MSEFHKNIFKNPKKIRLKKRKTKKKSKIQLKKSKTK
jgi:hypothetical protein